MLYLAKTAKLRDSGRRGICGFVLLLFERSETCDNKSPFHYHPKCTSSREMAQSSKSIITLKSNPRALSRDSLRRPTDKHELGFLVNRYQIMLVTRNGVAQCACITSTNVKENPSCVTLNGSEESLVTHAVTHSIVVVGNRVDGAALD